LLPLQEALGYDLAQSLFSQRRNLVLEGLTDYWYIEATNAMMLEAGEVGLVDLALIPANAAGKVAYFATILHAHNLKVAALLDSDAAGESAASQDSLVVLLGRRAILRTRDAYSGSVTQPEIEDLLRTTLLAIAAEARGWVVPETAADSAQPTVKCISDVAGSEFSKYKLARSYLNWTREHSFKDLTDDEQEAWRKLIGLINAALD
jgi:hypothetical protein